MNVVIFNSHTLFASHYETELEIILHHQKQGDKVVQLVCNKELPACENNPYFMPESCERCVSKVKSGYSQLQQKPIVRSFFQLTETDKKRIAETQRNITNLEELKKLWVDNFDVGYAVASTMISMARNPSPELEGRQVERLIISSLGVYFSFLNYLRQNPTDVVYIFNGRFSTTRGAMRACEKSGVRFITHERGCNMQHYSLFENATIHNMPNTQRLIREAWANAEPQSREGIAGKWYETRIGGKMENWYSFLENQQIELPEGWDKNKENILICNSSEDEVAALGEEWKNPLYINQSDGITRIIKACETLENLHVYLRIHPFMAQKASNENLRYLLNLKSKNLTIIPPASKLSTYELVRNASKVITFGSTIGVEATYMGRPSILAAKTFYDALNIAYTPASHDELMALIRQNLEPKPKENALMYGYFWGTFGVKFEYYEPHDFDRGTFLGKKIEAELGLKYKLIQAVFHNKKMLPLSEKLRLRWRERVMNRYLG